MKTLVELHSRNILQMVAFQEIFLLPFSVIMIFSGQTSIVTPFLYYRFLGLRYSSRRNPYCRTVCSQLRMNLEALAYSNSCPNWAKNIIYKGIMFVSNLAPATAAQ